MVTFRFYLVSIVAFFLALSVGVVLGSVLDDGISSSLKDRLERVEANLDETVGVMDQKNRDIADHEKFAAESEQYLVEGRLEGTTTLVVAESGLNGAPIEEFVDQLRVAGSNTPGIIWVDKAWDPTSEKFMSRLASGLGVDPLPHRRVASTMWESFLDELLDETPAGSDSTTTTVDQQETTTTVETTTTGETTTTAPTPGGPADAAVNIVDSALLKSLEEQSILELQLIDGDNPVGGGILNIVAITGTDSELGDPGSAVAALAAAGGSRQIPSVLAEQRSNDDKTDDERGALISDLVDDRIRSTISTVDDIDVVAGRVASIIALQQFKDGKTGSYGFGGRADSVLPKWPGL
ncbi:MAG: copper transporter [Microthrixaceae bacterium]